MYSLGVGWMDKCHEINGECMGWRIGGGGGGGGGGWMDEWANRVDGWLGG